MKSIYSRLSIALLSCSMLVPVSALAQDKKDAATPTSSGRWAPTTQPTYFKLTFVLKEIEDGKVINSRTYVSLATPTPPLTESGNFQTRSIRAGSKVPMSTGGDQYTYLDLGVSIDFKEIQQIADRLNLNVTAEISTITPSTETTHSGVSEPIIHQNRWNSNATVIIGKPTVLFTSDDLSSKRTMQLELTATPIN